MPLSNVNTNINNVSMDYFLRGVEAAKRNLAAEIPDWDFAAVKAAARRKWNAALGANLLKLKPGLEMKDGKLGVYKKYRGSIEHVYRQYIRERLADKKVRPGHVFLTESGEIEPAVIEELTKQIFELSGCREVHHTMAGCTISTHCGPKTLGVLFIEE